MSELSLLVAASIAAALAFFGAGLLLRRPRGGSPMGPDARLAALEGESARAQAEHQLLADELAEARRQCLTEREAVRREQAARASVEQERDTFTAECARLAAREKTLAERLRAAEDGGRAALQQVETNAAAWDARWQAAIAERQRQEQTLALEIKELRERHARESQELRQELRKERQAAELRERELRGDLEQARRASQEKQAQAETALQAKQAQVEAAFKAKQADAEAGWRATLATKEADWKARLENDAAAWRARLEAAEHGREGNESAMRAECRRLGERIEQVMKAHAEEREHNQQLTLALHAAEEALTAERLQVESATKARLATESRLHELDRLSRENSELRADQARLIRDAADGAAHDAEMKDARVELATAQAKLSGLADLQAENRRLRDEVAELQAHQADSSELERLTAAHKQLRLDAELMSRRLQELALDHAELVPLRAQVAEAAGLHEEVAYLRRREKDLEAQLYASGFFASRELPAISGESVVQTPVSSMETNLDSLVTEGGPRTAVLADAQGFLIAGAGESVAQEGLAAFTAVAGEMVSRARMLLPLADVESVKVTDANRMMLTCRLFSADGQGLGVATLGPGEPPADKAEQAVAGLSATLSAGAADDDDSG